MTSKSIGFTECCCFNFFSHFGLLLFYCQPEFGSPPLLLLLSFFRGPQSAPNVSHYPVWKSSYSFRFFTSPCIRGNLIFHISFWFVDVIARDAGSHASGRPAPLIRLTMTNCGWKGKMKEISTWFHGNWCHRPSFLMLPLMCECSSSAHLRI